MSNIINVNCGSINYPVGLNIRDNVKIIQDLTNEFLKYENKDTPINLLCMGSSGAIMAAIFATIVPNVIILHIKKDGESSHSSCDNYSRFFRDETRLNIIIDDFIVTGSTVNNIYKKIKVPIKIDYLILAHQHSQKRYDLLQFTPTNIISSYA